MGHLNFAWIQNSSTRIDGLLITLSVNEKVGCCRNLTSNLIPVGLQNEGGDPLQKSDDGELSEASR